MGGSGSWANMLRKAYCLNLYVYLLFQTYKKVSLAEKVASWQNSLLLSFLAKI